MGIQIEYIWLYIYALFLQSHIRTAPYPVSEIRSEGYGLTVVTVDQFAAAMASIQEAIANLGQRIDGQQTQQSNRGCPPPVTSPIPTSEDPHTRMDRLEQKLRQMRASDGVVTWEDFDGAPDLGRLAQGVFETVSFNTVIDVSRRELEALRQRPEESVTSFISRWREKISQIIDRPSEKDQISMIMRSLQPRFARHLMGFPHTDFGSLVQALYGIEEGIARGLWPESSPTDSKGRNLQEDKESGDVGAIKETSSHTPTPSSVDHHLCAEAITSVCSVGYAFESSFSEAHGGWIIDSIGTQASTLKLVPPRFRLDLHCSYHQGPGHDMDQCNTLRHAIQDLIDQGLVNLGQPSVTLTLFLLILHTQPYTIQFDPRRGTIPVDSPPLIMDVRILLSRSLYGQRMMIQREEIQIVTRSGRIAQPPPAVRPFEGATSHEEVRREDDEVLRQLQSTQPYFYLEFVSIIQVPSVLLDNGSALNVCPLATAIALGFAPSDFGLSTQTVRAYDSTKREVMGTLSQSYPSSLHQKVKFIHDGQVITVQSTRDMLASSEPVLQISHSEDDLFLTGFTFDEIQTLEIEDFHRDFVAMRRQQGPSEFIAAIDHDMTFGLGSFLRGRLPLHGGLRKERRIRDSTRVEEIHSVVHTDREIELQHLFHQLQLSDGAGASFYATPTSPDRASMLSLCFPEEITDDGVIVDPTDD
ncbi:hypothetical protein CK203_065363 [Vitis vinifera]|uniref:Retrotransposon gag domain-containing protein n=1 Tax=Vitis vinifera TaxID=29760 RepID=A0A438G2U2_VITVI|nr:hypothetical protein CK203_065363 [Vitis vinifera]